MEIAYIDKRFTKRSLAIIDIANSIIDEYREQGFSLTLRQLYYQFVARDLLPNKQSEYKKLGSVINDGRMAGLIDWEAIEDRTRNLQSRAHWDSPSDILEAVAKQYHTDLWADQDVRLEVWIEKEALVGVIERVCRIHDVPFFACRGYTSQSEQWRAAMRFAKYCRNGQQPVVLHLGDHDPSGIDMTRDNEARLNHFVEAECGGYVNIERLALNTDQIRRYNPPPNPAKVTDSRFEGYMRKFGRQSWELDALDPKVIETLIANSINGYVDREKMQAARDRMMEESATLQLVADRWDDVKAFVENEE